MFGYASRVTGRIGFTNNGINFNSSEVRNDFRGLNPLFIDVLPCPRPATDAGANAHDGAQSRFDACSQYHTSASHRC